MEKSGRIVNYFSYLMISPGDKINVLILVMGGYSVYLLKIREEDSGDLETENIGVRYRANVEFKKQTLAYSNKPGRYEISLHGDSGESILTTKVGLGW